MARIKRLLNRHEVVAYSKQVRSFGKLAGIRRIIVPANISNWMPPTNI